MHALIDGDLLPHEFGGLRVKEDSPDYVLEQAAVGDPLPFEICWAGLQTRIENILSAVNAKSYKLYLSSSEIKTWRYDIATILPYKGNRADTEKPVHFENLRLNMQNVYDVKVVEFMEADDAISIAQNVSVLEHGIEGPSVVCSRDKDLKMIPGWHYSWPTGNSPEKPLWLQTKIGGLRCFYKQLLTGDRVDNVLGLYGVGDKSSHCKHIDAMDNEMDMLMYVWDRYRERFGNYAEQFLQEMGQLLWMQTTTEDRWDPKEVLRELEELSNYQVG